MDEPAIAFREVIYRAQGRVLLGPLDLEVRRGETLVLLGRSGSGKTTALKLINRLLEESDGVVLVDGRPTRDWEVITLRRHIGYVIQETGLFPHYTVERNVGLVPRLLGRPEPDIRVRVDSMLRLVDLDPQEFRQRYPHQLSGGQRQRVGVARALAADPEILLMDEPFGALDPLSRAEVQKQFLEVQKRVQKTTVLVTHDVGEALLLASRIALLEQGRLKGIYSRSQFLESPDATVAAYRAAWSGNLEFRAGDDRHGRVS
ncbi:MAG TPA: ATP-binding cassette domain-containing protein [Terriglobales bacterium]|jgi:osmoprotectant transport system ATP-binding protein|nr:ATP-binding cassette domain-containing protein [Terriglobales bacterium]